MRTPVRLVKPCRGREAGEGGEVEDYDAERNCPELWLVDLLSVLLEEKQIGKPCAQILRIFFVYLYPRSRGVPLFMLIKCRKGPRCCSWSFVDHGSR